MKKKQNDIDALRKKAEAKLREQEERLKDLSALDLQHLVHELGTSQIEFEMQNEELRKSQIELEDSRSKYSDLYDFAPAGYFTFDKNGFILEVNLAGAALLQKERSFLIKKSFSIFIHKDDQDLFYKHRHDVFVSGSRQSCEIRLNSDSSPQIFVRMISIPVQDSSGSYKQIRTAVSDITESKERATEREKLHKELEHSNKALEIYSYTISNDLRAPLRSIEGFTQAILEDYTDKLDETGKDYLHRVISASRRMSQLIDALLTIASLVRVEIKEDTVDLSSIAQVTAYELKKRQPERRVEFIIAEKVKVKGDINLLRMVLENLLDNAWKFTGKHPSARIEFGVTRIDDKDVYFVRDDGAGFDMDFVDKLFGPFRRLHREEDFPGIGIGLAMVHKIIKKHGGKLWSESAPEKGAAFYFTLG